MRKLLIIACLLVSINNLNAQEFLGIRQSNYSGIMGLDYNPSSIADNRMKVDVLLFGVHVSGYNNHAYFNPKFMPFGWVKSFDATNSLSNAWMNNSDYQKLVSADSLDYYKNKGTAQFLEYDDGKKTRAAFINTEVDVLNFMVSFNQKRSIGFQIKNRTMFNLDEASAALIRLSSADWDYTKLFNLDLKDQKLNLSMNSWNEYNLAYAQVLKDDNQHFWKMGAKAKLLQGIGSFYLYTKNVDYNIAYDTLANYMRGDFDYGYSENLGGYIEPIQNGTLDESFSPSELLKKYSNFGIGFDIGVTYEFRPDYQKFKYDMDNKTDLWRKDQNKYKLRVAAAVNDIGGMKYKKGKLSRNFTLNTNIFDLQLFDGVQGFRSLDSTLIHLKDSGDVTFRNDKGEFYMNLPTHANIDIDYNVWRNIYLNYYMRLDILALFDDANTVHYPNSFALTPRWEKSWWGVSVPLSYNPIAGFRYGVGLRMGSLIIGTGDVAPFIAAGKDTKINGADFYFALRMPIVNPKPKDRDKDKVSDKRDACIDLPGVWAFMGCPDTDNDGIKDTDDDCPLDSGLVQFRGCPDTDNDGIIDKLDDCPTEFGLAEFKGCPDTDKDGIMDKEDDCPTEFGLAEFKGCPDTDNDGLKDSEDRCPTFPGPISNKGCPLKLLHILDSLNEILETDTMLFNEEKFLFNKLPTDKSYLFQLESSDDVYPDFLDVELKNMDVVKTIRAFKVGLNTYSYKFVKKGATLVLSVEEQEVLNTAFSNLEFETGKAIIKESSLKSLNELASLLIKKGDWALKIEGHTDNVGKASNNLKLSKLRSESVRDYLNANGVTIDRFIVKWFGHTKPIESNTTPEGRQKNRRVEMTVIQN